MRLIEKSERIDFVGLDLQGEENFIEKDMFFYDDIKDNIEDLKRFLSLNLLFGLKEITLNEVKELKQLCKKYKLKYGAEFDYEEIINSIIGEFK